MEKKVKKWLDKIKEVKQGEVDLSRDEDLSIALMNLVSLEEHFYFTAMKTNNEKYLELMNDVRKTRAELMKKIVIKPKGEEWCISKHLLAASMRLVEVGNKEYAKSRKKEATACYSQAFNLYSLFFAINNKMIGVKELEQKSKNKAMQKFSDIIKKIVDCCKEW